MFVADGPLDDDAQGRLLLPLAIKMPEMTRSPAWWIFRRTTSTKEQTRNDDLAETAKSPHVVPPPAMHVDRRRRACGDSGESRNDQSPEQTPR